MDELDELDPVPTDPDGAWCYVLAHAEAREMIATGQLPPASPN